MSEGFSIGLAKKRLVGLNPKSVNPEEVAEALNISKGANELLQEIINRGWSCDIYQLLLPFFRPLLQKNSEVRGRISRELLPIGLPAKLVLDYFLDMGNQPYLFLALRYEEVCDEARENFRVKAEEIMVKELRNYLFH